MKIAALVVGLIGALMTLGLGSKWVSDYDKNKDLIESLQKISAAAGGEAQSAMSELNKTKNAGYLMVVFGLVAAVAAALVFKIAKPSGAIMIAAALIPAALAPKSLVFSFFLIIAGVLALMAKPKTA
jgi:hypothetical protein